MIVHINKFVTGFSLAISLCLGIANVAFAGGGQIGKITYLTLRASDGLVLVELDGSASDKPACALYSYWILKNETSLTGKQQIAFLLTAKAAGQTVAISGAGSCTRWHDGEDIDTIQLR